MKKKLNSYNVCFLGRTGNGKSSLINALWDTQFKTDGIISCTKELYSVSIMNIMPNKFEAITIYDTPGIGEFASDSKYERYYEHAVGIADCIVLVTTLDRTDAPAQRLLQRLKPCLSSRKNVKFIVALNHIDSSIIADENYVSWDENLNMPTPICANYITERIKIIHEKFDKLFLPFEVVPVCAIRKYGIDELKNQILKF